MINTLNETHLHKTLKNIYALQNPQSKTEEKIDSYIADIVTEEKNIIEIQTANLAKLLPKIKFFTESKKNITVVYPLITTKYIETLNPKTQKKTKRKSPKKQTIYSLFKELTALHSILLNKYFTLEVLEITMTEERQTTSVAVQSKNKRRRFKKEWIKTGKRLESIDKKYIFKTKQNYLKLLPKGLNETFTVKDVLLKLKENKVSITENETRLMLWVFTHAKIIKLIGKEQRKNLYSK